MACRKFGVTTPDIKAREKEREKGEGEREGERERERATLGEEKKSPRERYWFKDISSFSTYFSYWDFYQQVTAPSLRVARVKDGWQLAGL